jgi:hypothetical protein
VAALFVVINGEGVSDWMRTIAGTLQLAVTEPPKGVLIVSSWVLMNVSYWRGKVWPQTAGSSSSARMGMICGLTAASVLRF